MGSPYDFLGVRRDADLNEIKRAYRRLAKESHPDVNVGDDVATERFKRITAAYNLLADKKSRVRSKYVFRASGRSGTAMAKGGNLVRL